MFKRVIEENGVTVDIHHINDPRLNDLGQAEMYSSSLREEMGKPIRGRSGFQLSEGA